MPLSITTGQLPFPASSVYPFTGKAGDSISKTIKYGFVPSSPARASRRASRSEVALTGLDTLLTT